MISLEAAANDHSDSIEHLEKEVSAMKKQIDNLKARNDDLETCSRCCNLRITGIREGREDCKHPMEYMAWLLQVALSMEEAPVLDWAHQSRQSRQEDGPPRAWIIRCHYFQECKKILGKARALRQVTTSDGDKIRILPDYSTVCSEVRGMLRSYDGVQSGLWYLAELHITVNGTYKRFKDPTAAKEYVMANIVK